MITYTIELYSDGTYSFNKSSKPLLNRQQLEEQNEELILTIEDYAKIIMELKEENKQLKDKLDEILELTEEPTGMIHLRKAQIRSIIKGD